MKIKTIINGTVLLGIFIGAVLFNGCQEKCKIPEGAITPEQANILEENYKETRSQIINKALGYDSLGIEDPREIWFSLERMKQYIDYVENLGKEKKLKNLGLRFYLGAYPETKSQKSLTTLFVVPTATNIKAENQKINYFLQPSDHDVSQNVSEAHILNFGGVGQPSSTEFVPNQPQLHD